VGVYRVVIFADASDALTVGSGVHVRVPTFGWPVLDPSAAVPTPDLQSLTFNAWSHSPDDLMRFVFIMFQDLGLIAEFGLAPERLQNMVMTVRANYRDNPFHNWYHGFSVMHFAYVALRGCTVAETLSRTDVLAVVIAALAHDIDHPGRNNSFEMATDSDLAFVHNDQAVLENHHALTLFTLLRSPGCDVLKDLAADIRKAVRKAMIYGILATGTHH
jgi:hypothetical protein